MLKKRVIIVEDRPLARTELKYLLSKHPDVEVVGEFEDTASAWPVILAGGIDGAFLDIDIETEGNTAGLDLAIRIDRLQTPKPWLVFTSGMDYGIDAIQVRPYGYLVKPYDDAKLAQILDRTPKPTPSRIRIPHMMLVNGDWVRCIKFVSPDEILYIQTCDETVKVQLTNGEVLQRVHIPLHKWKTDFCLPTIKPIHRRHLVNFTYITGIVPDPFRVDGCSVTLKGCDQKLPVGRNALEDLRREL